MGPHEIPEVLSTRGFMAGRQKRAYRNRRVPQVETEVQVQVNMLIEHLKTSGPARCRDAAETIGVSPSSARWLSILCNATDQAPIWQDDGYVGIIGYGGAP